MTAVPHLPWTFDHYWDRFEQSVWTTWPNGMPRDQMRAGERFFAFAQEHELRRRWDEIPRWILQSADIHERFPLWVLYVLDRLDLPFEDADKYLGTDQLPFSTPEDFLTSVSLSDPVWFAETHILQHPTYKRMTRYWAFQKRWMRLKPDRSRARRHLKVIQCSGFGVGKSKRLVDRSLYKLYVEEVDVLLGAHESSHVYTLFDYMKKAVDRNPVLKAEVAEMIKNEGGFPVLRLRSGQTCYFRWAGTDDGDAWRSLHIHGGMIVVDEAAKIKGDQAQENWNNFLTRAEPGEHQGAEIHASSVPDGAQDSHFFQYSSESEPLDTWNPKPVYGQWNLVRDGKDLQPPPWNTPERREETRDDCRTENKFRQQWFGEHGSAAEGLWDSDVLMKCIRNVDGFQGLSLRLDKGVVHARAYRLDAFYDPKEGLKTMGMGRRGSALSPTEETFKDELKLSDYLPRNPKRDTLEDRDRRAQMWFEFLSQAFECPHGHLAIGMDVGEHQDPTVLGIARVENDEPRELVGIISLVGLSQPVQADILYAVAHLLQPAWGWSLDATGRPALLTMLYEERLIHGHGVRIGHRGMDVTEVLMNSARELLPEIPVPKGTDVVRASSKHIGVSLLDISLRVSAFALPWDPMVMRELPAFEREAKPNGSYTYSEKNDHLVAALICLFLHVRWMREQDDATDAEILSAGRAEFGEPEIGSWEGHA